MRPPTARSSRPGPPTTGSAGSSRTGIVGISHSWWVSKHNRHHANPNRVGKDPDIEVDTISLHRGGCREGQRAHALITRRQGWLFFPLLTLEGLNLHVLGLKHLFAPRRGQGPLDSSSR